MNEINPAQLQTTEELRQFAEEFNWDDGAEVLFSVMRNPRCDKGTALCIFWQSDPISFFELYANQEEAQWATENGDDYYRLLVELQEKYVAGFYVESDFYVDPEKEAVGELTSDKLKTPIPDIMRKPSLQ
jgi:hypothetical protein